MMLNEWENKAKDWVKVTISCILFGIIVPESCCWYREFGRGFTA